MIYKNHKWKYFVPLLAFCILLLSCQKTEPEPEVDIVSTLLSTGWKMEKYLLHYSDGTPDAESDTLVLTMISSDTLEDTRAVYTESWIVFDEAAVMNAYYYDLYYLENGSTAWEMSRANIAGEAGTPWEIAGDNMAYLNLNTERPIHIDIIDADHFVLRDAYRVKITDPFQVGDSGTIYYFGDYPSGNLIRIDECYRSATASEGPDWFPAWSYWPLE